MKDHVLWVEKYRPSKIEDCVLPKNIAKEFATILKSQELPNLLLCGVPGTGKTTAAKALCDALGMETMFLNGSLEGRQIDIVRNEIKQFASSASFQNKRKVVIMDEADYMNKESVQPALRGFIEQFSSNTSFIFTCNHKNKIIAPLRSRFIEIEYSMSANEKPKLAAKMLKRCEYILKEEGVDYDQGMVAELILHLFPDFRRVIIELQRMTTNGHLDSAGIKKQLTMISDMKEALKQKSFKKAKVWCAEQVNAIDPIETFTILYDELEFDLKESSLPTLILILADYQYKATHTLDQSINMLACMVEIMAECEFK